MSLAIKIHMDNGCEDLFPRKAHEDDAAFDQIWEEYMTEFHAIDLDALKDEITRQIAVKMGF